MIIRFSMNKMAMERMRMAKPGLVDGSYHQSAVACKGVHRIHDTLRLKCNEPGCWVIHEQQRRIANYLDS